MIQRFAHSLLQPLVLVFLALAAPCQLVAQGERAIDYSRDIRPLLSRHCYVCHGPDPGSRESGLRLDRADNAFVALGNGKIPIVPGAPERSEIIARLTSPEPDERMPPTSSGHTLSEDQIELVRQWISDGAAFDDHWSFRSFGPIEPPTVQNMHWARNPIDQFVLSRLEKDGIETSPEANRSTLIRRLSLDLRGLPPSVDEVDDFLQDGSSDAYERLVDRILASPSFGERWGRHWLDLAHFADSNGYLGDALRPNAWLYRDWVVEAFNADMPFDQFTIEQLAGDLLPNASLSQKTATGFLRNTLRNDEAGVDLEEYRLKEIVDRVSTIGAGWLGLSLGCAECHSHKYDPISQKDFYEVFAFFNDADDIDVPIKLLWEQEQYAKDKKRWDGIEKDLRSGVSQAIDNEDKQIELDIDAWFTAIAVEAKKRDKEQKAILEKAQSHSAESIRKATKAYEQHFSAKPKPPATKVMTIGARTDARETYVHLRGDYRSRGEKVNPGTPSVLPPIRPRADLADRLDFARWLVDTKNPLTARVTVNQFWAHLFGQGLVPSVDNFGVGGDLPSHPELLDWLSNEFVSRSWSRKDLLRLIVCSSTYRQSAAPREDLAERDPTNQLLARQSRIRLEAEAIRDTALFSAGLLERKLGGPGIRPPQPSYVTSISRNAEWNVTKGGDQYRRGLYIVLRRATPYPMLLTFDAPDSTIACTRRERSNSPLQALTLLNDPVYFECAQSLGHWLATRKNESRSERIQDAFRRCLGRKASPSELDRMEQEFNLHHSKFVKHPDAAKLVVEHPAHDRSELAWRATDMNCVEEATWIVIARILMNVDEFITRE